LSARSLLSFSDSARRFITLVDELYEHQVKLVITAFASAEDLFPRMDKNSKRVDSVLAQPGEEEMFAFSRTLSRLHEMQSTEYLQAKHKPNPHDAITSS
jgi:cell division protein ZapE